MYIVVEHTITNRDVFFGLAAKSHGSSSWIRRTPVLPEYEQRSGGLSMGSQVGDAIEGLLGPLIGQRVVTPYYAWIAQKRWVFRSRKLRRRPEIS